MRKSSQNIIQQYFRDSRAAKSVFGGKVWPKIKPIQAFIVKNSIVEIAEINKEANTNTKWELIKGTVRNETIKYATYKKKETIKQEKTLTNEITQLQKELVNSSDANRINLLKDKLDEKSNTLEKY